MSSTTETVITPVLIEDSMTYKEYRTLIDELLEEGKTTGKKQSEALTRYTKMNVHRMKRLDKYTGLNEQLKEILEQIEDRWIWLVITEGWCGDAAQNLPTIARMAEVTDRIKLRLILREEYPEVMDTFLTNGSRSIPKLICLEEDTLEVAGTWGPRPQPAQDIVNELKNKVSGKEYAKRVHKWYADDKTQTLQQEFLHLIGKWSRVELGATK